MIIDITNNKGFVWIPRTASTSIGLSIVKVFYPELENLRISLPAGRSLPPWQMICPKINGSGAGVELFGLIRNPIDRFISACAHTKTTPSEAIKKFQNGEFDIHFTPVSKLYPDIIHLVKWFRLEDQLKDFCQSIGIPENVDQINESIDKPTLSSEEVEQAKEIYKDDIDIYAK